LGAKERTEMIITPLILVAIFYNAVSNSFTVLIVKLFKDIKPIGWNSPLKISEKNRTLQQTKLSIIHKIMKIVTTIQQFDLVE